MVLRSTHLAFIAALLAACAGNDPTTDPDPVVPGVDAGATPDPIDAPVAEIPDAAPGTDPIDAPVNPPLPDAPPPTPSDGGETDPGGDGLPPDPGTRFLTAPPPAACTPDVAASWTPQRGFSGGIPGTMTCGPSSPSCPTTYVPGNSGAPCDTEAECTGPNPVCLKGGKYATGTCSATGCELGSNFGCHEGGVCILGGDAQTYCVEGCGIDESGCFVGCERDGFSCFNTESKSLGTCFAAEGVRQCDPKAAATCTMPTFGDGICIQTSWDDQTVGRCFETCDPLAQDCSRDHEGCYVLREYKGYPVCFQSWGYPEGTECDRMTECAEGLRCACDVTGQSPCETGLICRRYCNLDGSTPCGEGTFCTPLAPGSRWGSCLPPQP